MNMSWSKARLPVVDRRRLLGMAAVFPLLVAAAGVRAQAVCVNLDTLPAGQKGMRRSLGFKLVSDDPKKHCGSCTFFSAAAGGCGKCQLLSGGAVGEGSVCDSWAQKG